MVSISKRIRLITMCNLNFILIVFLFAIVSCANLKSDRPLSDLKAEFSPLKVSSNARYLVTDSGRPVFLNSGTEWRMVHNLDTSQVKQYFKKRKEQRFNAVGIVALNQDSGDAKSAYGKEPFKKDSAGKYDPLQPNILSGEYDFWDHLDYVIDKAEENGFYVILLPTWGTQVAGLWNGDTSSKQIFNQGNAYGYGKWIGERYRDKKHVIWMMGGDVMAVVDKNKDYREIFRSMAAGVEEGFGSPLLMSYHPRKKAPNSSEWFHNDAWLDFNSIQEWPEDQIREIGKDYQLDPIKPTWLFEGRYEDYKEEWKDWQIRYQAYQTVFAGGFGHTYGHERIWGFFEGWETQLDDPGAWQMQHLYTLMTSMTKEDYLNRIPNQNLIIGDQGISERLTSTRIQATQGSKGRYAFIYSANGRNIHVKMDLLAQTQISGYWFNPRNGKWHKDGKEHDFPEPFEIEIKSGTGAPDRTFDPPGSPEDENDWILVLR